MRLPTKDNAKRLKGSLARVALATVLLAAMAPCANTEWVRSPPEAFLGRWYQTDWDEGEAAWDTQQILTIAAQGVRLNRGEGYTALGGPILKVAVTSEDRIIVFAGQPDEATTATLRLKIIRQPDNSILVWELVWTGVYDYGEDEDFYLGAYARAPR